MEIGLTSPVRAVMEISIFLSTFLHQWKVPSLSWPTLLVIDFRVKTAVIVLSRNGFIYFGLNLSTVSQQNNDKTNNNQTFPCFQIKLRQSAMGHRASTSVSPPKSRAGAESSEELLISPLALLPSYSVLFRDTQTAIFSESGPLPIPTRHFLALMVRLYLSFSLEEGWKNMFICLHVWRGLTSTFV